METLGQNRVPVPSSWVEIRGPAAISQCHESSNINSGWWNYLVLAPMSPYVFFVDIGRSCGANRSFVLVTNPYCTIILCLVDYSPNVVREHYTFWSSAASLKLCSVSSVRASLGFCKQNSIMATDFKFPSMVKNLTNMAQSGMEIIFKMRRRSLRLSTNNLWLDNNITLSPSHPFKATGKWKEMGLCRYDFDMFAIIILGFRQ